MSNGKVYCWGDNTSGQTCVSLVTADMTSHPVLIPNVDTASTVLAGGTSACALLQSGQLRCWGDNDHGQLGTGDLPQKLVLVPKEIMAFSSPIKDVSLGESHACAALESGELYCWGADSNSELGDGDTFDENLPTLATSAPPQVVSVSAGGGFTCAGTASGQTFCWGSNEDRKAAPGDSTDPIVTPALLPGIDHALSLSLGYSHACAVLEDHSLVCWGADDYGEASGKGVEMTMPVAPTQVTALCGVAEVHVGDHFSCARLFSGEVRCFGRNDSQQISPGNPDKLYPPTLVKLPAPATHLAVGSSHACASTSAGVYCWGDNGVGELGAGNFEPTASPVLVMWP
jgi:alpha-tubulin suppressor-like RCC1 family protein